MKDFIFCWTEPVVLALLLLPVCLQSCPGSTVVAAAVGRCFSLAVLQEHVGSTRQEQPEETPWFR